MITRPSTTRKITSTYLQYRYFNLLLVSIVAFLIGPVVAKAQTCANGYNYCRQITIDHNQVPNNDLTNFPLLVSDSYPYLATTSNGGNVTNPNGYDIAFTDATGNLLAFEQESYSSVTGAIVYWVKVPLVSHLNNTVIYMMYGNPSVATFQGGPRGSVWDSNYVGVWHLSDNAATTTISDSTSDENNGTNQANTNTKTTTGEIAGALNYNGSTDYTSVAGSSSLNITGNLTVSAWLKGSNNSTEQSIFGGYNPVSPWTGYGFELYYGALRFWSSAQGSWVGSTTSSYADGNWHYVVVVNNGSSATFYKDGMADGTPAVQSPGAYTGSKAIGGRADGAQSFDGTLEEVRVSNIVRSADSILAEYNNQNYPPGFYSVGDANTGGQGSTAGVVQTHITNIASNSASFSNPVTRGNLLVAAVLCVTCPNSTMSVSDTLGGTWQVLSTTGFNGTYEVWWSIAPASGADNVTINSDANAPYWDLALAELTGVTAPDQVQTSTMNYVNNVSSGSVSTSAANEVLLGLITDIGSNDVPSPGAGWTMPPNQQYQFDLEYQSVSSIGSYAATGNYTTSPTWQAQILTFMPSTLFATSSISPSSGLPTQAVTITGTGFGGAVGSNSVLFNGIQGKIVSWGESAIVVEVPQSISAGTASVVVTLNGTSSNAQTFTVLSGPGVVQTQVVAEGPNDPAFSYPVTQGNVLTVSVMCASCWGATLTISDTLGSTWHTISTSSDSAGVYSVWWTIAPASGNNTITIGTTVNGAYWCTALAELYGVTSPDQFQIGAATGNAVSSGPVTTTQASEVLLGTVFNQSNGESASQGTGWILAPDVVGIQGEHPFQLESQVVSSIGTYTATATYTSSPSWRANIITFIGSANGGGGGGSIHVSVDPSTMIVGQSGTDQFSAVVTGTSNQSVTWSINPAVGAISSGGLYTAPATIAANQTITVTALSNQDGVTFGTATITLTPPTASGIYYYLEDELGTSRVIADSTGTVCYDADFYPYGGERTVVDNCPQNYKFTGKERDSESNLDNFEARYYSWQMGRFMTPDWSKNPQGVPYADFDDPQTLNLYSYVRDNPTSRFDEDGHAGDCVTQNCYAEMQQGDANSAIKEELSENQSHIHPAQNQTDCHCGTKRRFKNRNRAATAALNAIFPTSQKQHVEYGGRVYKNADGTYSYTTPVSQNDATTVNVDAGGQEGSRIPLGTTNAGIYHTHESVPGYIPDQFSDADGMNAVREHVPNYIETPSGLIHEIDGTHANSYLTAPQYTWPVGGPIP